MNGSKASITDLCKVLSAGPLDPNVEVSFYLLIFANLIFSYLCNLSIFFSWSIKVIVGCPAVYISFARGLLPASINIAGQVN